MRGLVKHYGETKALDGVDLDVREGTVMGVLGPNGAGKTTLVRIPVRHLITPDSGQAHVAGYDVVRQPRQLRRVIGLTGQYASVDEKLPGWENLYMIGRLLDLPRRMPAASGRRTAGAVLAHRGRQAARGHLLGRHAAAAGPGGLHDRAPGGPSTPDEPPPPAWIRAPATRCGRWGQAHGRRRRHRAVSPPSTWRRPSSSPPS
ncbi:ATP-binding cassette domain-containing protein [Streptomyces thinghirensis]|nr:ATP-binding cassette domain-containing protein [Streptomyces thinghirensis]